MELLCLREQDLYADPGFDELKEFAKERGDEPLIMCFAGDESAAELFRETLGISPGSVKYIGPADKTVEPIWWWGFIYWVCDGQTDSTKFRLIENSKLVAYDDQWDDKTALGQLGKLWSQLFSSSAELSYGWFENLVELSHQLRDESGPPAIRHILSELGEFAFASAVLARELVLQPNALDWSTCNQRQMSSPCCRLVSHGTVAEWNVCAGRLSALCDTSLQSIRPKSLDEITVLGKTLKGVRTNADDKNLRERIAVWSGLVFVQAEVLRASGMTGLATIAFWRALEIYYHKVAYENEILVIDSSGSWQWGSAQQGSGQVTAHKIIQELDNCGVVPGAGTERRGVGTASELRRIRNNSLWTHGFCCGNHDASKKAGDFVWRAIVGYEGSRPRWRSAVDRFRRTIEIDQPMRRLLSMVVPS